MSSTTKTNQISPAINLLKLLAILLMTIDHIGYFLFPDQLEWRAIGRLAAPIFTYLIVVGLQHTRDWKNYALRLLILAIVSQMVFLITVDQTSLNIIFNFLGVIILLKAPIWAKLLLIPLYSLVEIEYGWLILAIAAIYYFVKNKILQIILASLTGFFYGMVLASSQPFQAIFYQLQSLAGFSSLLIFSINRLDQKLKQNRILDFKLPKYLLYFYYPAHWIMLYMVSIISSH